MLYATCVISDPWIAGKERFRLDGVILSPEQASQLNVAAERIGYIYHELTDIVWARPDLLEEFYELTPYQKAMWLESEGRWHGIARIDLFLCTDGSIKSCEMNSDTPSGEAEAVLLNELLHRYHPNTLNPNVELPEQFWQMLVASHQARLDDSRTTARGTVPTSVAIIYPTDLPEDLSMIAMYRQWLEARGCRVVIGSPYNLNRDDEGNVTVLGQTVDLVIRHYKTDWWGEREVIWTNQQPFLDAEPLHRELLLLLEAEYENKVTVVNPFGSVLTQNKASMALMWERQELFSAQAQEWIQQYIPETRRLQTLAMETLNRAEWVLKSTYGCEGDSVLVGHFAKPNDWQLALTTAIPKHWVAQRYFEIAPLEGGLLPNFGAYLIGGAAAGFYTRLSAKSTDYTSVTAPTFVAGAAHSSSDSLS